MQEEMEQVETVQVKTEKKEDEAGKTMVLDG